MKAFSSPVVIGDLAKKLGLTVKGNSNQQITNIAPLDNMQPGSLSFLTNPRYQKHLTELSDCVVVLADKFYKEDQQFTAIISENPYLTYAQIVTELFPIHRGDAGIHPHSQVHDSVMLGQGTHVAANCFIDENSQLGSNVHVSAGVAIGKNVTIGDDTYIYPNVTLCDDTIIGERCIIYPGAVVGADGFGLANDNGKWYRVPQIGRVVIGNDVEIGVNTTIDRGALEDTVIADGARLDNQVHVAHNVQIGENTAIAGQVGIAGSTKIGASCTFGGAIAINGHIEIGDNVHVTGMSMVTHNLKQPGLYSSGIPTDENRKWRRNVARFQHLDELAKKVKALENRLGSSDDKAVE